MTTTTRRPVVIAAARRTVPPAPASDTSRAGKAPPTPRKGPGSAPRPSTLRMVSWQAAGILGIAAYDRPLPIAIPLGATAAVLLVAGAVRVRGVWLSTRASRRIGRWCRRPATVMDTASLLRALVPGARLTTTEIDGEPAGTISRPDGLVVAFHTDLESPPPAASLAVREVLRPRQPRLIVLEARRDVDAPDDEMLAVVLGNAIRRMRRTGHPVTVLGANELSAAIAAATGLPPGPVRVSERRDHWRLGHNVHIGLKATDPLPSLDDVHAVARTPGAATAVVVLSPAAADRAVRLGLRLERLDDRHGLAVIATLPIGGPLP